MRRCYHEHFPIREDRNEHGTVVRRVSLPPVKCRAVATLRNTITWPNGDIQHTYACPEHAEHLRKITTDAGFPWDPRSYTPKR